MYKVIMLNDNINYTVHSSGINKNNSKITSGSIVKGINTIGSFTFTILRNNPIFNYVYPYSSLIQVYNEKTKKYEFKGRILKIKPSMSSNSLISKTIICEDRLGFLQDSVQPYLEERHWEGDGNRTGLEEFVDHILDNHNSQVEDYKKIYRGIINVKPFESSNNITKSLNYESTWDVIQKKLIDSFGGEIQLREEDNKLYLDYLIEIGEEKSTTIAIKKNMQSVDREIDPTSFITKLIPLGAKLEKKEVDSSGNTTTKSTEERLTIASVNNGSIFIEANEINRLGSVVKTVQFDDVTDPINLLRKGNEFLQENNKLLEKHTLKALDLSFIDKDIDEFDVGNYHPIKNDLIDINEKLRIIKKTINILEPLSSTFDVGDSKKLLSSLTIEQSKSNNNAIEEIKKDYVPNITLVEEITKLTSLISQTSSKILLEVAEKYTQQSDYTATTERLANLIMQVDSIQQSVSSWGDLTSIVEGNSVLELPKAIEGPLIYLSIRGEINLLYPSNELYPADDLYPIDDTFIIEDQEGNKQIFQLPFINLHYMNDEVYDEFIVDNGIGYLIQKVGIDKEGNFYQLEEISVKELGKFNIDLANGLNKIYLNSFPDAYIKAKYVVQNAFSNVYATTVQLKSSITQLADSINLVVSKKVGTNEIISSINQSAEEVKIMAEKLSFYGATFDMTANNINILSDKLSISSDGKMILLDDGLDNGSGASSFIVKREHVDEISGQKATLKEENKTFSDGRYLKYDCDNKIDGSSGYGEYSGYILENLYRYPATTWGFGDDSSGYTDTTVGYSGITTPILTQTSLKTQKKNLKKYKGALNELKKIDIYKYNLKFENDSSKKHLGFIIGEGYNYSKLITNQNNTGVDNYSFTSLCLQAIKEQQEQIELLSKKIIELKKV